MHGMARRTRVATEARFLTRRLGSSGAGSNPAVDVCKTVRCATSSANEDMGQQEGDVAQRQEATDLGSVQCGFESHRPYGIRKNSNEKHHCSRNRRVILR